MGNLILSLMPLLLIATAMPPSAGGHLGRAAPDHALDFYGNVCWEDEKARLDNFAITLQENPDKVGLIIVYAGPRSCAGEAQFRAKRAKKWVEGRGVAAGRVLLKDGGYQEQVMTWLWVIPRDLDSKQWPVLPQLEGDKVRGFSKCKGKIYRPAKCSNL